MSKKQWKTADGHIKESAIKEAQEIIEAMMAECDLSNVLIIKQIGAAIRPYGKDAVYGQSLADLYINRLHELNGTTPPQF